MDKYSSFWGVVVLTAGLGGMLGVATPASAALQVCNNSSREAYVAVGYSLGQNRWRTEGWLRLQKGKCGTVIKEDLNPGSFYYLYASDKNEELVWQGDTGDHSFCIKPDEDFTLTFAGENCIGEGIAKRNFWEVLVKGKSHTENLVD